MVALNFMTKCDSITNVFVVSSLALLIKIWTTEGLGQKCYSEDQCPNFSETCNHSTKKCDCNVLSEPYYERMVKKCNWTYGINNLAESCAACKEDQMCTAMGYCRCKDKGTVLVDRVCYNVTWIPPLQKCNITYPQAFFCDETIFSECISGQCTCPKEDYIRTKYDQCITKIEYKDKFKTEGKGENAEVRKSLLKEPCNDTSDCLDGLACGKKNLCECTWPCSFYDDKTCDCGDFTLKAPKEENKQSLIPVVVVGVVLSICSLLFWGSRIRAQRARTQSGDSQTRSQSVPLDPVTSEVTSSNRPSPTAPLFPHRHTRAPTSLLPSAPVDRAPDAPPAYDEVIQLPPSYDSAKNQSKIPNDS